MKRVSCGIVAIAVLWSLPGRAQSLVSADCINCTSIPTADIQWIGSTTDVGWPYVAPASFQLAEIETNFGAALGVDRMITAEIFKGVPGQADASLLGSVTFSSALAHGQLGGAPFPSPIPVVKGEQYFLAFLNVGGLGLNVDADNDFMGPSSDPDASVDTCDGKIPADPACDADGAALRLLGSPTLGGLHIDRDGSATFSGVDQDLAPVALDAPIIELLAAPTTVTACIGDCNGDGQVSVAELLTMVDIAFGSASVAACAATGANQDGQVTIEAVLAAVDNALDGCPGTTPTPTSTPTPTVPPATPGDALGDAAAVTGRTTIAVDSLGVIAQVIGAVANGVQSGSVARQQTVGAVVAAAASACPLGGTASRTGSPVVGETITLTGCTVATFDGTATADGSISFGLFSPLNINVQFTFKNAAQVVTEVASMNATGSVSPTLGGTCFLTQATLTLTGSLTRMTPGGPTLGVNFSGTTVTVGNITFSPACVPTIVDLTFDGPVALLDPSGGSQNVTFHQLTIHIDSSGNPTVVTVNGGMESSCFGGMVTLTTQTPLSISSGEDCPTGGVILAQLAADQAQITFLADGSVTVQTTTSGTLTAPNCLDSRLLMCAA